FQRSCVWSVGCRYSIPRMATRRRTVLVTATMLVAGFCFAQFRSRRGPDFPPDTPGGGHMIRIEGGEWVNEDEIRTAREVSSHSPGTPEWTNPAGFEQDVFTFTRIIFQNNPQTSTGGRRGRFRWLGWWVDYPDADLNFSYRLQQLTSMKSDPD